MDSTSEKKFWAFISYSSKDKKWGQWLHRRLESYPIPEEFQGTKLFDGAVLGENLRPIFRDRDELSGSSELGPSILKALSQSRFLIVLCSKNSAQSEWVNKEIEDFKALGGEKNILALILDGEPNATANPSMDDTEECFPPALRYPDEPLAGDLRKEGDGKERGFLKVISGIAQLDFDVLYRRHERIQRKKRMTLGIIAALIIGALMALSIFAFSQKEYAQQQEKVAQQKTIAERKAKQQTLEQLYFSSIANANASLAEGSTYSAMQALATSPENLRSWEWSLMADLVSFAPIEMSLGQINLLDKGELKGSGLLDAARGLLAQRGIPQKTATQGNTSIYTLGSSRSGGVMIVGREPWLPPLIELETTSYGNVNQFWISPDESMVLVLSDPLRMETHYVGDRSATGDEQYFYLIPLHRNDKFLPFYHIPSLASIEKNEHKKEYKQLVIGEHFIFKSYGAKLFTASSYCIEGNCLSWRPTSSQYQNTDKECEFEDEKFRTTAPYAAYFSLNSQQRKALKPWFYKNQLEDDEGRDLPQRLHLDVDFSNTKLPLLSVSYDGVVSVTPMLDPDAARTFQIIDKEALSIWKLCHSYSSSAYDIGGVFNQDGSKFVLAPFTRNQAALLDSKTFKPIHIVNASNFDGGEVALAANDQTARPGSAHWNLSPQANYLALSSYEAPSATYHMVIGELGRDELIYSRGPTRIVAVDWDQSESLFAAYDAQRNKIEVFSWPDQKALISVYYDDGNQGSDLIKEFTPALDRIVIGNSLFRKSDLQFICRFKQSPRFANDGSWVSFSPRQTTESPVFHSPSQHWARMRFSFPSKMQKTLADQTRAWQFSLLKGTLKPLSSTKAEVGLAEELDADKFDLHLSNLEKELKQAALPAQRRIEILKEIGTTPSADITQRTNAAFQLALNSETKEVALTIYQQIKFQNSSSAVTGFTAILLGRYHAAHQHFLSKIYSPDGNSKGASVMVYLGITISAINIDRLEDARYAYSQLLKQKPHFANKKFIDGLDLPQKVKEDFLAAVAKIKATK